MLFLFYYSNWIIWVLFVTGSHYNSIMLFIINSINCCYKMALKCNVIHRRKHTNWKNVPKFYFSKVNQHVYEPVRLVDWLSITVFKLIKNNNKKVQHLSVCFYLEGGSTSLESDGGLTVVLERLRGAITLRGGEIPTCWKAHLRLGPLSHLDRKSSLQSVILNLSFCTRQANT